MTLYNLDSQTERRTDRHADHSYYSAMHAGLKRTPYLNVVIALQLLESLKLPESSFSNDTIRQRPKPLRT